MFAKIPPWVFLIFLVLLVLGWRQARTRLVTPRRVAFIALAMLALSLYGVVAAFGSSPVALGGWVLGYSAAIALGSRAFGPRGLARVAGAVQIPGSWFPLGLMMCIFVAKFVLGFVTAVGSPLVAQPGFAAGAGLVFGFLSGGFAARALVVHRFATIPMR